MMSLLILNSPILTGWGKYSFRPLDVKEAQKVIKNYQKFEGSSIVSAVGHETTALFLTSLLGVDIPCRRVKVSMPEDGNIAIVLRLQDRLPEGKVLTSEEMKNINHDLALMRWTGGVYRNGRML